MSSEEWARMHDLEQAMHAATVQRQALQSQLNEIEHALGSLPEKGDAWRIIGSIMVKRDTAALRGELTTRQATLRTRAEAALQQEKGLRSELEGIQRKAIQGE